MKSVINKVIKLLKTNTVLLIGLYLSLLNLNIKLTVNNNKLSWLFVVIPFLISVSIYLIILASIVIYGKYLDKKKRNKT